jgi:hypothetical protein
MRSLEILLSESMLPPGDYENINSARLRGQLLNPRRSISFENGLDRQSAVIRIQEERNVAVLAALRCCLSSSGSASDETFASPSPESCG